MVKLDQQTRRRLWRAAFVIWMLFIWSKSLTPGSISHNESIGILGILERLLGFDASALGIDLHYLLRKLAHIFEYALLGALSYPAWSDGKAAHGLSKLVLLGTLIAAIDELLQSIAPDRAPMLIDVGIDCAGFILGLLLACAIAGCVRRRSS